MLFEQKIQPITVGEFSRRLKTAFGKTPRFKSLAISGEVSGWGARPNGSAYFTLKDADATLQCFSHANRAALFGPLPNGSAVVAFGDLQANMWRSSYELLVDRVELTGIGELYRRYEALKARFAAAGFFDRSRKRGIPAFPLDVALISARGKGAEDFENTLRTRVPHVRVEFIETRVQGLGADVDIAEAVDRASRTKADVIVLARGGGSYEDLFSFNCEPVVQAIVRSKIPVITAVGHTADHHLADDAADYVCETPSNAAQFIAGLWWRGGERLAQLTVALNTEMRARSLDAARRTDRAAELLERSCERRLVALRQRVAAAERAIGTHHPLLRAGRQAERLTELRTRLNGWPAAAFAAYARRVESRGERLSVLGENVFSRRRSVLELAASRLDAFDSQRTLELGFAIMTYKGRTVRAATDVAPGDSVNARLAHGSLQARVENVQADE